MDFKELTNIVETLQPGESMSISAYDNIIIRKSETPEIVEVESPFSSRKQYEAFIKSCFGKVTGYAIKMDDNRNLRVACVCPDFLEEETFALFIRKLGNPNLQKKVS